MTEAQIMMSPPSFLDLSRVSSFCAEMFALIPDDLLHVAYDTLEDELKSGIKFPDHRIGELLKDQIVKN